MSTRKYTRKSKAPRKKYTYQRKYGAAKPVSRPAYRTYQRPPPPPSEKPPGIISAGGKAIGDTIHPIAGFLGGKLGHLIEKVTGFGDYTVSNNSILKGGMPVPQIVNSLDRGSVIVRHREYLGDILASSDFSLQSFLINPGLSGTFPWLSSMANSFEQYSLRGMLFEFNSTSSDAVLSSSTSTALGSVIMQTDYDVADPLPTTKRDMLNCEFSSSSKPSCSFIHPIECKKSITAQNILYTRAGLSIPSGFDQRLYDFARFNIAVEGCQANTGALGELWVTYEMELYKQQFNYVGQADHFRFNTITNVNPLGQSVDDTAALGGTLGGTIADDRFNYVFPESLGSGKYMVMYCVAATGSVTMTTGVSINLAVNCSLLNYWGGSNSEIRAPQNGAVGVTHYIYCAVVQISKQGAILSFNITGTLPTGTQYGDLTVIRLPDSFVSY